MPDHASRIRTPSVAGDLEARCPDAPQGYPVGRRRRHVDELTAALERRRSAAVGLFPRALAGETPAATARHLHHRDDRLAWDVVRQGAVELHVQRHALLRMT